MRETKALQDPESGEKLIRAAFETARTSGHQEWTKMTTAVLKNRILELTNREFEESDWGATSFRGFLAPYGHILRIDASSIPATVHYIVDEAGESEDGGSFELGPTRRVRNDLWIAILDYSSSHEYVWDGTEAQVADDEPEASSEVKQLPTVSLEEFRSWRTEFIDGAIQKWSDLEVELKNWEKSDMGLVGLPAPVRQWWVADLKKHVVERLSGWFTENDLAIPDDLVHDSPRRDRKKHQEFEGSNIAELRSLAISCVKVMTREELETLAFSPNVILRAKR